MSSLPSNKNLSETSVVQFFDNYFTKTLEFPSNDFDAVVGFFTKRGFEKIASIAIAQVLLSQAKIEGVKIFKLLDTLSGYNKTQLSKIILAILNAARNKTSKLGIKKTSNTETLEQRNIVV